jgi:hypothetical protein
MPDRPADDLRADLTARIDPLARAARLALLLDERQPDAVRADALGMRAERLFWTLTQLDDGLPLELCQALVRAARLGRGDRPVADAAEATSAELAAAAAGAWLRRRWRTVPGAAETMTWLAGEDGAPPAADGRACTPPATPGAGGCWLDLPPLTGPPPGAERPSLAARLLDRLRAARRRD